MIAESDKVVCRNLWRWTDPASGKKMQFHGFVLWRFSNSTDREDNPSNLQLASSGNFYGGSGGANLGNALEVCSLQ
jgi:hypothetical protein